MKYSFIIRKAKPEDAPAIRDIMQEAFSKYAEDAGLTVSMDALQESLEDIIRDINTK